MPFSLARVLGARSRQCDFVTLFPWDIRNGPRSSGLGSAWSQATALAGLGDGCKGQGQPRTEFPAAMGQHCQGASSLGMRLGFCSSATRDGAGSKQGSNRLDEASQSGGGCEGTVLSRGTRARQEWAAPSLVGRAAAGQEGLSLATLTLRLQTPRTGALATCRSGSCGQSTSTGCHRLESPSRSCQGRTCVPCPRSSSASARLPVVTSCTPTSTSGSLVGAGDQEGAGEGG